MLLIPALATYVYGFDVLHRKMQDQLLEFDYSVVNMQPPFAYIYIYTLGLNPLSQYFTMDPKTIKEGMDNIGTYDSFYKIAKGVIGAELYLEIPSHNLINIVVTSVPTNITAIYTNGDEAYTNNTNVYTGNIDFSEIINVGTQLALSNYLQTQLSAGDILGTITVTSDTEDTNNG